MKKYTIYTGTYNTSSFHIIASYNSKKWFIKKLRYLCYEQYWGSVDENTTEFYKSFGSYSLIII